MVVQADSEGLLQTLLHRAGPRLGAKLPLQLAFLLSGALSTFSLSRLALHSSHIIYLFPSISFALLALVLLVKRLSRAVRRREALSSLQLGWQGPTTEWTTAAVWSIGEAARMLAARQNHVTVWGALQISLVPLCAFLGLFRSRSSTSLLGALTFAVLISLQLWSIRSSPLGIALSALQIAAECWKWRSLQLMAHEEDGEDQLMRTSGYSSVLSLVLFLLGTLSRVPSDRIGWRSGSAAAWLRAVCVVSSAGALYCLSQLIQTLAEESALVGVHLAATQVLVLGAGMILGQDGADTRTLRYSLMGSYLAGMVGLSLLAGMPEVGQEIALNALDEAEEDVLDFGEDDCSPASTSTISLRPLYLIALLPLAVYFIALLSPFCILPLGFCHSPSPLPTLDIVIAHYDKSLPELRSHMNRLLDLPFAQQRKVRLFLYEKGEVTTEELWRTLPLESARGDEVVRLENWGREGATYLRHILAHYPVEGSPSFADITIFLQSHLGWPWLALHRLTALHARTGFLSIGPYISSSCGNDGHTGDYAGARQIWELLQGSECVGVQSATWAGQVAVSRKRILANPRALYQKLDDMIEAPDDDPIHRQWGPVTSERSNPSFGHALERSWSVIFNCSQPALAEQCPPGVWKIDECQCRD